jgi:hypothetical protein
MVGGWFIAGWKRTRRTQEEVRSRCAVKMQLRVGVGIEVEVVCSWSSEK